MTTPNNNTSVHEDWRYPTQVPVTTNITINQGDMVYWDGTNYTATPLSAATQVAAGGSGNSAGFMGVAGGTSPFAIYGTSGGVSDPVPSSVPVDARGCFFFATTVGETYLPFDAVTVGADAQTVVKAGATNGNRVGFVIIEPPVVARPNQATPVPESIVGAAGQRIRVQIEPKHIVALAI